MRYDYLHLMQEESRDLADFLGGLSHDEWNSPSLCAGWRVREVVSHMAAGHTASMSAYLAVLAQSRFSVDRASDTLARTFAAEHAPAAILAAFREGTTGKPKGPTALVRRSELFTDHLIHHQDIRRPLCRTRVIPQIRLAAALHALPHLSGRVGSAARMRGLRVVCEDVEYVHGDGAEVRGRAEALVMALCGRGAPAAELRGEGAVLLGRRLAAEAAAQTGGYAGGSADLRPGAMAGGDREVLGS